MRYKIRILLFFFFQIFQIYNTCGQSREIDSLYKCLKTEKRDTIIAKIYYSIAYNLNSSGDSAEAIQNFFKSIEWSKKSKFYRLEGKTYSKLGTILNDAGNYDSSLVWTNKAITVLKKSTGYSELSSAYTNRGTIFFIKGRYNEAMNSFLTGLKIAEEYHLENKIGPLISNISVVYFDQKKYDEAMLYCKRAIAFYISNDSPGKAMAAYNNLGNIYFEISRLKNSSKLMDSALFYYKKAASDKFTTDEINAHSTALGNIGNVYSDRGEFETALKYYLLSIKEKEKLNDKDGLSFEYANIGQTLSDLKKYKEAIKYLEKGYSVSTEIQSLDGISENAQYLSEAYDKSGDKSKALFYFKIFKQYNDSIYNADNTEERTQLMLNYEFNKKEERSKISQARKDALKEEELKRQRFMVYLSIVVLLLVAVFTYFLFRANSKNKKANVLLSSQKEQIEQTNEELNQQNEEIAAQRDEIENQKSKVEIQHQEIKDSILYAKRIQQALLTSEGYVTQFLPEYFVLFKPKDVVSGDFYWFYGNPKPEEIKNDSVYISAADCTGHGVPGAFMSMMGINFLNEIVVEKKISAPDEILNELRKMIISALNPKGSGVESKDGMDIVLCNLNTTTLEINFASANNPLYIVREFAGSVVQSDKSVSLSQKLSNSKTYELTEYKADKFPVGKYNDIEKSFTLQTVQLQKNDQVYLFSDGFADQFGGSNNKKFKYKQLQDLLLMIADMPLTNQKEILNGTFENWRGDNEQVDDVLIIGIRV